MSGEREKARVLAHWLRSSTCGGHGPDDNLHDLDCNVVTDKVEATLRSAREEERKRCIEIARTKYANGPHDYFDQAGKGIARAIESGSGGA